MTPKSTIGMLGGKIGPMAEEARVMPTANRVSYPFCRMALTSMDPRPATSARTDPDIPAKMRLANTFTCPSPPGIRPTNTLAKSKILSVIFPAFMVMPAAMNSGMARKVKFSKENPSSCAPTLNGKPFSQR